MPTHIKSIASAPKKLYPWQRPDAAPTTIGVINPCYGSSHVIYGLDTKRYQHRTLTSLPLQKLDRRSTFFQFTPFILDSSVPLVHTWNAVPFNRDFIVSFELELPRYLGNPSAAQTRRGMRILESDRCKRILALSYFARNVAQRHFVEIGFAHLAEKMDVFRGAIPDVYPVDQANKVAKRASFADKPLSGVVIGTQLFRKGGMYAIQAFERLRACGIDVRLTLIGDFENDSYAFGDHLPDQAEWRARARSHEWIRFVGPIPNSQVYPELLAHDVCIYTSLDESLGWLPIEAGMLGVPVLGAAVCAFPELVGDQTTGWLVNMPLRADGRWSGLTLRGPAKQDALKDANRRIVDGIEECMLAVNANPALLERWGVEGRRRIADAYGKAQASAQLERIYDAALK